MGRVGLCVCACARVCVWVWVCGWVGGMHVERCGEGEGRGIVVARYEVLVARDNFLIWDSVQDLQCYKGSLLGCQTIFVLSHLQKSD